MPNIIMADQPSGGQGLTILASGTYTKTDGASTSMSIPVSYSGNCALMLVYAEPISGVDQTNKWVGTPQPPKQIAENFSAATTKGMCEYTTSAGVTNDLYSSTCKIENGNIVVTSQNSSRKIQPNTYYWYLWG